MQPTDTLINTQDLKAATVSNGAASIQWTDRETSAIWYYVWWTGAISPLGANAMPGTVTADGGWAFIRSTNCTGDTPNTCDTSSVYRQVVVYAGSSAVLHVWAAPISDKAATYHQLRDLYAKLDGISRDVSDIKAFSYYVYEIHGEDFPALQNSIADLSSKLDMVAQNQQQQAEADKPAQDNAKEQQEQTENLKKEGDKSKYETDTESQRADLLNTFQSLQMALTSGDKSCAVNLSDADSRLNLGTVDFCAGTLPVKIQKIAALALFSMAIALPVRAVRIMRDVQVSARDDAQADKIEKHVEVTT